MSGLRAEVERKLESIEHTLEGPGGPHNSRLWLCRSCAVAVAVEMIEQERVRVRQLESGYDELRTTCNRMRQRAEASENLLFMERGRADNEEGLRKAAEKALAEARGKWGHVAGCQCGPLRMGLGGMEKMYNESGDVIVHVDPRCATEVKRD